MNAGFESPEEHPEDLIAELATEREAHAGTRARLKLLERTLMRFVPRNLIDFLGKDDIQDVELGDQVEKSMSVMFTDIRDFTSLSESMTPQQPFNMINSYFSVMNPVITAHQGIIDKYMGDAIMALFPTQADDALSGALSMLSRLDEYNAGRERAAYAAIRIGIGVNTGLLMLGVIGGANRMEGTVISHAVNLASRLQTLTKTYGTPLLISEHTLYSLSAPEQFLVRHLGRVKVAYKTHPEPIYEVFNHDVPEIREKKSRTLKKFEEALARYHSRDALKARPMLEEIVRDNPADIPAKVYLQRCEDFLKTGLYNGSEEFTGDIAWRSEYQTGITEFDIQHSELIGLMEELHDAYMGEDEQATALLQKLESAIRMHFEHEEKLMRDHRYPFAADHIAQHRSYLNYFDKLGEEISSNRGDRWYTGFRIKLALAEWMLNHSNRDDRHLAKFLIDRGILASL